MANKVTIDNVETIPLGNPDLMDIIIGLAARIETLERKVEMLNRRTIGVPAYQQRHSDTDKESDGR
ncbi:MAG: hypothetical protein GTO54_12925 [Nitrososphaeria archaeon]|nr:hypothetical protein [Nitrososphaeria archaeon]